MFWAWQQHKEEMAKWRAERGYSIPKPDSSEEMGEWAVVMATIVSLFCGVGLVFGAALTAPPLSIVLALGSLVFLIWTTYLVTKIRCVH